LLSEEIKPRRLVSFSSVITYAKSSEALLIGYFKFSGADHCVLLPTDLKMSNPPIPAKPSLEKYRDPSGPIVGNSSSPALLTVGPAFMGVPHLPSVCLSLYQISAPPCPPGMSLAK